MPREGPMQDDSDRLTEIEIALSHQQAMLEDLSDVIRAQGARIDLLSRRIEVLLARQAEAEAGPGEAPDADTRPPHW